MKRVFSVLVLSTVLSTCCFAWADDPATTNATPPAAAAVSDPAPTAASIAAQQATEERFKRMNADIESLQAENESLKTKLAALEQKLDDIREKQASAANSNNGIKEDLKRVADSIAAVDKRREEDRIAISEQIRVSIGNLEKSLAATATPAPRSHVHESDHETATIKPHVDPDETSGAASAPAAPEAGFSYTIQEGQTLSEIVNRYNQDFKAKGWKQITVKQAMAANPKVNWTRLYVGQKIIIPKPEMQ